MFICSHYEMLCFLELDVREVARDYATGMSEYNTNNPKLFNSYDVWHGMDYFVKSMPLYFTVLESVYEGATNVAKSMEGRK